MSILCKERENNVPSDVTLILNKSKSFTLGNISVSSNRIKAWSEKVEDHKMLFKIVAEPNCPQGNWNEKVIIQVIDNEGNSQYVEIPVIVLMGTRF